MQRLTLVRYTTKTEASAENERLSRAVFDQIRAEAPKNIAYGLFRIEDEFIHLFVNLAADNSDAVTDASAFHAYQADLAERCTTAVQPTRLSVEMIDSYGLGRD
jgi:hypothetical protein